LRGTKGLGFVPHGVGEGSCRRSLRRREVGGKCARRGPSPLASLRGTKGLGFVPHGVGEGPCRRSLRRREVGGKRETGWSASRGSIPLASLGGTKLPASDSGLRTHHSIPPSPSTRARLVTLGGTKTSDSVPTTHHPQRAAAAARPVTSDA